MRKAVIVLGFVAAAAGARAAEPEKGTAPVAATVSARAGGRSPQAIPPVQENGVSLSLSEAIAIALAGDVDLDVSVYGAEAGRAGMLQASGIFDPLVAADAKINDQQSPQASSLSGAAVTRTRTTDWDASVNQLVPTGGTFTFGWNNEKTNTNSAFFFVNPRYSSNAYFQLQHPLLRNFGIDTTTRGIRLARNTRDADEENFLQNVQATVNAVEQAYWDLVYARSNLKVKEQSLGLAQELFRITKIKIDVGSQAPIDIVQTESGVAQRELDIITARQQIGDAEDRLKRLLNFAAAGRWSDAIVPTDEVRIEPVPIDLEAGMARALHDRPEVHSALFSSANARIQYDFAKNQTLPQLDLLASLGYAGLGGPTRDPGPDGIYGTGDDPSPARYLPGGYSDALTQLGHRDFRNWTVGVNFSFPVFNRAARGARGVAKWQLESSLASVEQLRQNVSVQVRGAARVIATAQESIGAAGKARELAEKNVDAEKKKYDNGLVTSFEVLQVQNDFSAASTAELQALTVYRKAIAAYHLAVGDNLTWKDVTVDDLAREPAPAPESLRVSR
jgi:outer membrane protein TolC